MLDLATYLPINQSTNHLLHKYVRVSCHLHNPRTCPPTLGDRSSSDVHEIDRHQSVSECPNPQHRLRTFASKPNQPPLFPFPRSRSPFPLPPFPQPPFLPPLPPSAPTQQQTQNDYIRKAQHSTAQQPSASASAFPSSSIDPFQSSKSPDSLGTFAWMSKVSGLGGERGGGLVD